MRKLTFKGFLIQYIKQLSDQSTISLKKLAREACTNNPRLREPLCLYALCSGKQNALLEQAKNIEAIELEYMHSNFFVRIPFPPTLYEEFSELVNKYTPDSITNALMSQSTELKDGYKKVWNSYQCVRNAQNDLTTKELIRKKVQTLLKEKGVTSAKVCAELSLDPGNFSAWVFKGNNGRIGLKSARLVLEYLTAN